jgi:hypothetical protein
MSYVNLGGVSHSPAMMIPYPLAHPAAPAAVGMAAQNASGKRSAWVGQVSWADGGTHNIAKVGLRFGTTTAGTSQLTLELQGINAATYNPGKPDGTAAGAYTWTANTVPTANALSIVTLDTKRNNVAQGAYIAVVTRWASYTSGTISLTGARPLGNTHPHLGAGLEYDGAAWALIQTEAAPIVLFESDDATPVLGWMTGASPCSAFNAHAINTGTDPRRHAMKIHLPISVKCPLLWIKAITATLSDYTTTIYNADGSTLATQTYDSSNNSGISVRDGWFNIPIAELLADTVYYITLTPTTGTSLTLYSMDVVDVKWWDVMGWGDHVTYASYSAAGAWTETTTRRLVASLVCSQIDIPSGAAGISQVFGGVR